MKSKIRWDKDYSIRVLDKADRLINEGRVIKVSDILFYVIGDHGKYFVRIEEGYKVKCTCPGFKSRGFCSHSVAVLLTLLREDYARKLSESVKKRLEENLRIIREGPIDYNR